VGDILFPFSAKTGTGVKELFEKVARYCILESKRKLNPEDTTLFFKWEKRKQNEGKDGPEKGPKKKCSIQ